MQKARIICRIAMHHARQGEVAQAQECFNEVRTAFGGRFNPEVAAILFVAEGVLAFFQGDESRALDRMRRGYGIANSMNAVHAKALCAAWMAHLAFNENRYPEMVRLLRESLNSSAKDDHAARARLSLVLADAFHFSGRFDRAAPWYTAARLHATAEGDEATLSALLHNIAAFRASNLRLAGAVLADGEASRHALLEAKSAFNFDSAVGTLSFGGLLPLLQAQVMSMRGDFVEALQMLHRIDVNSLPPRLQAQCWAELAYCEVSTDLPEAALQHAGLAADGITTTRDADDRAYVHSRLALVFAKLLDESASKEHSALAIYETGRHRGEQAALLEQLVAEFPEAE
ncbi:MAG: hypothetical protein ACKVQR_00085 [Aquabacterium sp.]